MRLLTTLFCLGCLAISLQAADNAASFLDKGAQPRAAGFGMGYSAFASGSDSVYWNPAGLTDMSQSEVSAMGYQGFETNYVTLQGSMPLNTPWGKLAVGAAYISSRLDGIQFATLDSVTDRAQLGDQGIYSGTGYLFGAGININSAWSIGSTLKVIQETAAQYGATGVGIDVGTQFKINPHLTVAGTIQNLLQPNMGWNTPSKSIDVLPMTFKAGIGIEAIPSVLNIGADVVYKKNMTMLQGGVEYWLSPQLPLRVGANRDEWSIGTGLTISNQVKLDFAWTRPMQVEVPDIYRIALTVGGF